MKVLLIYPLFPKSFWSFEKTLELSGHKALLPPLSLITIAAIFPQTWEFRLIDRNIGDEISEADWQWADLVAISGMIVQKPDMLSLIREARERGKKVTAGGPYVTTLPQEALEAGVDFLVLDEGEITIPLFVDALERGETSGIFHANGEKPDITLTPIPRYDLLNINAYGIMPIQFSRGCPFLCEFCDIIVLYGRKPRTKTAIQIQAELQTLYDLGWQRAIFMVDDNFIGNKREVKKLLKELIPWMSKLDFPFAFTTEASLDLAEDDELLNLMVSANFKSVFVGIETPDIDTLILAKKRQNTRRPMVEAIQKISQPGLRVMGAFIIGFDDEKPGAGQRIIDFVEATDIPQCNITMLQVLPNTALHDRLKLEGRLLDGKDGNMNQTTLSNFVPTRPIDEIAREYINCFWYLYEPKRYLERTYQHYLKMKAKHPTRKKRRKIPLRQLGGFFILIWRQGIKRKTRFQFWQQLISIFKHNPKVVVPYIVTCGHLEHFIEYRQITRDQIERQLAEFPTDQIASTYHKINIIKEEPQNSSSKSS